MKVTLATNQDIPHLVRLNEQIQYQHAEYYTAIFKHPI